MDEVVNRFARIASDRFARMAPDRFAAGGNNDNGRS